MRKGSGVQLLPAAIERTEVSDLLRLSRSDPQSVVLALSHHPNFLGELLLTRGAEIGEQQRGAPQAVRARHGTSRVSLRTFRARARSPSSLQRAGSSPRKQEDQEPVTIRCRRLAD